MEYDNKANIIKIFFFKNGEPIPRSYRYQREDETAVASISFQFDEQRHVTEVRYFDKNGALHIELHVEVIFNITVSNLIS